MNVILFRTKFDGSFITIDDIINMLIKIIELKYSESLDYTQQSKFLNYIYDFFYLDFESNIKSFLKTYSFI